MSQQQATELTAPFSREFRGLDTSSAIGSVPVDSSPVFHNCDIDTDGAVVRRRGTAIVTQFDLNASDEACWVESIRTRLGSEYLVTANSSGFLINLMRDNPTQELPTTIASVSKSSIWTTPPSSMQFLAVSSPYDRLLVLTPEHPIVQLSFLERTLTFNCTTNNGAGNFTITSPLSNNDTTLWRDNVAANYILTDVSGNVIPVTQKQTGFTLRVNAALTVGQNYTFTLRQITWQWWAESMYYEGADFYQTVNRSNVNRADVNVPVPPRLYTDLDPVYGNSQGMGIYAFSTTDLNVNAWSGPVRKPTTDVQYGLSTGGVFDFTPPNAELSAGPFFITFGNRFADTTIVSPVIIARFRELRFRGGVGNSPQNLDVYVDNTRYPWLPTGDTSFNRWISFTSVENGTDRVIAFNGVATTNCKYFGLRTTYQGVPYTSQVHISDTQGRLWFVNANDTWYRNLPAGGGTLDGTYVRAYGIGRFVDYSKRNFHAIGAIYRDRLVLVNPSTAQDQLIISESGDESVPGEYYQFFQVTDMLSGAVTDPFTVNVTTEARETITALTGWQGNLFVFTNSNTYSLNGGEQFGESSYAVNLVSTYGAFNNNCVVVTNLTVLYMNRFGLFDLMNKPNTNDSYGAFERSINVRSQFNDLAGSDRDLTHWLHYNEANNRLYVGLALPGDTRRTSRNLMLNVTWDSWTTLSSAAAFSLHKAVQVFRYTLLVASTLPPRHLAVLCTEMPFYMDYAQLKNDTYPFTAVAQRNSLSYDTDARGIFSLPLPVTPGLNDFTIPATTKTAKSYQRNGGGFGNSLVTWRNAMLDYGNTLELLGGNNAASVFGMATPSGYEPFTVYPTVTFNGVAPELWTVTQAFGTVNKPLAPGRVVLVGMLYPSVYASPVFDLDSMGRLKRLRRLHLQMDTTVTSRLRYSLSPNYSQVKILNTAFVSVISNYGENIVPSVVQFTTDDRYELRQTVQLSIPLQGLGCDYQFYVSSVGAEAFKLAAYEFEVQPQRDKRYVRR